MIGNSNEGTLDIDHAYNNNGKRGVQNYHGFKFSYGEKVMNEHQNPN